MPSSAKIQVSSRASLQVPIDLHFSRMQSESAKTASLLAQKAILEARKVAESQEVTPTRGIAVSQSTQSGTSGAQKGGLDARSLVLLQARQSNSRALAAQSRQNFRKQAAIVEEGKQKDQWRINQIKLLGAMQRQNMAQSASRQSSVPVVQYIPQQVQQRPRAVPQVISLPQKPVQKVSQELSPVISQVAQADSSGKPQDSKIHFFPPKSPIQVVQTPKADIVPKADIAPKGKQEITSGAVGASFRNIRPANIGPQVFANPSALVTISASKQIGSSGITPLESLIAA